MTTSNLKGILAMLFSIAAASALAAPSPAGSAPALRAKAYVIYSTCAMPVYPEKSKLNEETGTTVLNLLIASDGHVANSKVLRSSQWPDLDQATLAAYSVCTFVPSFENGKPVPSWLEVSTRWSIN